MICSHCGAELPETSVFCPECGTFCTLPQGQQPQQSQQSRQSQQPAAPEPEPETIPVETLTASDNCPACGQPLTPGTIFCTHCGTNTCAPDQEAPMRCAACGAELTKGMQLCPRCEAPIYPTRQTEPEPIVIPEPVAEPEPIAEPIVLPEPIVPIPTPVKTCTNCGAELTETQLFCTKCGTSTAPAPVAPTKTCANCGAPLAEGQKFCSKCGKSAMAESPASKHCVHCGAALTDTQKFCTKCGKPTSEVAPIVIKPVEVKPPVYEPPTPPTPPAPPKPKKKKKGPGPGARVCLRLLSFLLCLCLTASLLLTVVVLDLRQMTSQDNLQRVISSSLTLRLPNTATVTTGGSGTASSKSDESILRWVYDSLKEELGSEMDASYAQMEEFFEKSSAKDFLAEKSASYLSDLLSGTNETDISRREIAQLINENADLIEEVFGEAVTPAMREDVLNMVESAKLDELIEQELIQQVRQTTITGGENGYTVEQLLADLNYYTSDNVLWALVAINVLILVLLLLTNWFRLSSTIKCAAIPMIVLGALLSIPTVLLQILPTLLTDAIGGLVGGIVSAVVSLFAPVHYITLAAGIVLLILSAIIKGVSRLAEE